MALSDDRADLAAAASTITGITGTDRPPAVISVGSAWPQLGAITRGDAGYLEVEWRMIVVVAPTIDALIEQMDTLVDALFAAFRAVMYVESVTPVTVATGMGDLQAVEIRGRKEL